MIPIIKNEIYTIDLEVRLVKMVEEPGVNCSPSVLSHYPWCVEIIGIAICWGGQLSESLYCTGEQISQVVTILSKEKLSLSGYNIYPIWCYLYYHFQLPFNFVSDSAIIAQCCNIYSLPDMMKNKYKIDNWEIDSKKGKGRYLCLNTLASKRILTDAFIHLKRPIEAYMDIYIYEVKMTVDQFTRGIKVDQKYLEEKLNDPTLDEYLQNKLLKLANESSITGRFHPTLNLLGANTGRISSSGANILSAPLSNPTYGKSLIADEGYEILCIDFNQLEPTIFAGLSYDPILQYAVSEGKRKEAFISNHLMISDLYLMAAYEMPWMREELLNKLDLSNWRIYPEVEKQKLKELRNLSKMIVNMTNYGAGPLIIQEKIFKKLGKKESIQNIAEFQKRYWELIPIAYGYKISLEQKALFDNILYTMGGFSLHFDKTNSYTALSRYIQTHANICMKLFLTYFYLEIKKRKDVQLLLCDFYDACRVQVKKESIHQIYDVINFYVLPFINQTFNYLVNFSVTIKQGETFYDAY